MKKTYRIRVATPSDAPLLIKLIQGLAKYERLSHEMIAKPSDLKKALSGATPSAYAIIAEVDGVAAGFALYFFNFSTFLARQGLYLEDLFVLPDYRGHGIGLGLFKKLAAIAKARKCGRMEWSVLDWNLPATKFYKQLGAKPMKAWTIFRLQRPGIEKLASR